MYRCTQTTAPVDRSTPTHALISRLMEERGHSFNQAMNQAIRDGLNPQARTALVTPTFSRKEPGSNLDKAVALAGHMEDDEPIRKMRMGV